MPSALSPQALDIQITCSNKLSALFPVRHPNMLNNLLGHSKNCLFPLMQNVKPLLSLLFKRFLLIILIVGLNLLASQFIQLIQFTNIFPTN